MSISIADRIARYKVWLNRQLVDRPMIGLLWEPEIRPLPEFLEEVGQGEPISPDQIRPDMFLPYIERYFRRGVQLVTDIIQPFAPAFGIPWVEAIVGCPVVGGTDSVWVQPFLKSYDGRPPIVFDRENPWLRKLLEFTQALVDLSDGRFPVAHPPLHRPLYTLAQMRGQDRMCLDLIDNPPAVKKILGELADMWINIADACLEIIPPFHGGYSTWIKMWAPGRTVNLQNEIASLISPKMYKEFILPLDQKVVAHFPYQSFHLHGSAHHQIDVLLTLDNLMAQQIVLEHNVGGPPLEVMLPAAKRILEKKPLLLIAPDVETAEICISELPWPGLFVQVLIIPRDLGREYDEWLEAHCAPG